MVGILKDLYLYKGSEVDNEMANHLIDEVYRKEKLYLINIEIKSSEKVIKSTLKTVKPQP